MLVFVQGAAEAVVSSDIKTGDLVSIGERCGQRAQRSGVGDTLMRPVTVIEALELAQGVQQVCLVPDQGPVEQLVAAGLHSPLHD